MRKLICSICFAALFLVLSANKINALNYYWIGGTGNWNDLNHWATTPGGTVLHNYIPTAVDDVFFDAHSFNAAGQTVTLNPLTILCNNLDFTGVTNMPSLAAANSSLLKIYGSLKFSPAMITTQFLCSVSFEAITTGKTITMAGHSLNFNADFNGIGGGWTLQDTFNPTFLNLNAGTLNSNSQTINTADFFSNGSFARTLNMGSSVFNIGQWWAISGTGITLNCGTSVINCTLNSSTADFWGNSLTYYDVNFTGIGTYALGYIKGNNRFHNVVFNDKALIDGSNTFYSTIFKKDAEVNNNNNYTNITFAPGYNHLFYAGTIQAVSGIINATGNCGSFINISSNTQGSQCTISHPAGAVNVSYVILKDVQATGGANFTASNAVNNGNNTGWTFTLPASNNLYWIGNNGNWDDGNHWSFTSGGAPSGCAPTPLDNVFFDANSFSLPGQVVTINTPNVYCRDITWSAVTNNPSFTAPTTSGFKIYGSVRFSPAMTTSLYCDINFEATAAGKTITMAGQSFNYTVDFNGIGGAWTLQDTFNAALLGLNAGTLTTNNQTVNTAVFTSNSSFVRTLNMGTSIFNVGQAWVIQGSGITLNCGTSVINCTAVGQSADFKGNSLTYYDVNFTGVGTNSLGSIDGNNRFHNVVFYDKALIQNSNTFYSATFKKDATVGNANTYTNITFAPGYSYSFLAGMIQTVSGTINAIGNCGGYINISSDTQGSQFTINHPAGAVNISFAILKDVLATGGATYTASNSIDISNNTGWTFTSPVAHNLYWVGNNGDWNDGNHWSFTSGGAPSGCSPTPLDNVFFDANSFSLAGQAVAISTPNVYCRDITWSGVTNHPSFTAPTNSRFKIYGSVTFSTAMTTSLFCNVSFEATTTGKTITMAGQSFNYNVIFNGIGGGWTLQDTFNPAILFLNAGTLNSNNQTVNTADFFSNGSFARTLNMGSSIFNINQWWAISGTGITLNCGTSVINCTLSGAGTDFHGNDLTYYDVNFTGVGPNSLGFITGNNRFHNVVFYDKAYIRDSNTFHSATFKKNGGVEKNNSYDDLIFTAGYTYTLSSGSTQTVNNNWWIQGSCVSYIVLKSSVTGQVATVTKPSGSVAGYNIHIKDIACTGGAVFNAYNSVDQGGNSGWIFSQLPPLQNPDSIVGPSPVCLGATNVIYHISPAPGSIYYQWTVPSGATIISGQGDTTITVNFGTATSGTITVQSFNGCNYGTITNTNINIIVSAPSPAVTLSSHPGINICPGNTVTFVAQAQDTAGIPPRYDFMVNGNNVQSGFANSFTSTSLLNGDIISCIIALPATACYAATTATSNSITIIVGNISQPSIIEASVCNDQLPYLWNGQAYDSTGDYTQHFINSTGCDSTVTLHLTIANNTPPSKVEATVCNDQLPYLWNGQAYNSTGEYTDHFTNSAGCDSIITLHLFVEPPGSGECYCELVIPNVITPNGDGINDLWKISHTTCILKTAVYIYNRYGSLIYHADDYQNNWNGTFKSAACPDGTYYYVIKAIYASKLEKLMKGNITILR